MRFNIEMRSPNFLEPEKVMCDLLRQAQQRIDERYAGPKKNALQHIINSAHMKLKKCENDYTDDQLSQRIDILFQTYFELSTAVSRYIAMTVSVANAEQATAQTLPNLDIHIHHLNQAFEKMLPDENSERTQVLTEISETMMAQINALREHESAE